MSEQVYIHDPDAERAVLGSLLMDPDALARVADWLRPEHFHSQVHAWYYATILELAKRGTPADAVTLPDALEARLVNPGFSVSKNDVGDVIDLILVVPTAIYAEHYARIVVEHYERERERQTLQAINAQFPRLQGKPLADLLDEEAGRLRQGLAAGAGVRTMKDAVTTLLEHADEMSQARKAGKLVEVTTPFAQLNDAIVGLLPGDMVVLVGEFGIGKSGIVSQIAAHVVEQGHGVQMFVTEMDEQQVAARRMEARTGIWSRRILTGDLTSDEWATLLDAAGKVSMTGERLVLDAVTFDAQLLESKIRRARADLERNGIDLRLVIFDYLQLFRDSKRTDRRAEVGEVVNTMREITNRLGLASIVVSSLSREGYKQNAKPHLRNAKETGDIEYSATIGLSLYRKDYQTEGDKRVVCCDINKNRMGPIFDGLVLGLQREGQAWIDPVQVIPLESV